MPRSETSSPIAIWFHSLLWGPQILAFIPAMCLAAYWIAGEGGLIACALGLPVIWSMLGGFEARETTNIDAIAQISNKSISDITHLFQSVTSDNNAVLMQVSLDDEDELLRQMSAADLHLIQDRIAQRYQNALRSDDVIVRTGALRWAIALAPGPNLNLESAIQHASRMQGLVDEPLFLGDERLYISSCIGFTMIQFPVLQTEVLLEQTATALSDARLNGPDAIRAFSPQQLKAPVAPLIAELNGDIETCLTAWFQPQISTDTGQVCGFEALARWRAHDGHLIAPAAFLPALERSGQMGRLTELMLSQSLSALNNWDKAGLEIESVGVNFSETDLANPRLFETIAWDLDRFNVAPHRLCIEVLESVIAGDADDMIVRTVRQLADLGCQIDLDDFGTGHASISTLRRLPVRRLKIDRSFVAKADLDNEQQKMVATILMMADRMGLSCLADGVETLGEHTILAQLGCRYVQGFGIARPMAFEDTLDWIKDYRARLDAPPEIGRKSV